MMNTEQLTVRAILDGDNAHRIVRSDGFVLGWIRKWYQTDQVNKTGIKMFRAEPAGHANSGANFNRFQSALGFLEHWWEQ
ncbi:MAG TPA: hypothetical protein VJQ59_16825 [Candidatus Sulfotelmatobacter sp.]|nr:hypothetical protein [Candidatus Sulfotelmatobacter sp.]